MFTAYLIFYVIKVAIVQTPNEYSSPRPVYMVKIQFSLIFFSEFHLLSVGIYDIQIISGPMTLLPLRRQNSHFSEFVGSLIRPQIFSVKVLVSHLPCRIPALLENLYFSVSRLKIFVQLQGKNHVSYLLLFLYLLINVAFFSSKVQDQPLPFALNIKSP